MLFKRFVIAAVGLFLSGLGFHLFSDLAFEIESGDTYYVIHLPHLFIAAGISMIAPGAILLYIELIQKKTLPQRLTKISFILHLGGLLILLTTMLFPYSAANLGLISTINTFVFFGLFLTVAGMSIIPAVLMISLRKSRKN
jgi:heme/copper-type cytochrome/quinol oxidase subunit 1